MKTHAACRHRVFLPTFLWKFPILYVKITISEPESDTEKQYQLSGMGNNKRGSRKLIREGI